MTHRFLPHTADLLVELEAPTLEGLFAEATEVTRSLLTGSSPVDGSDRRNITVAGSDAAELLHHYVRELLTLFQLEVFVPSRLDALELTPTQATAVVAGEGFDDRRHEPQPEVKAVTRHGLRVERIGSAWLGTLVFDM